MTSRSTAKSTAPSASTTNFTGISSSSLIYLDLNFLRTHHAVINASPEEVQFRCQCPESSGPMETLVRYTPVSRPLRHCQRRKKSVLSAASRLYKSCTTGLVHSDFLDPQLRKDQYQRSSRNRSSNHILLLSRNLDSTTTCPDSSMQQMHTSVTCRRRTVQVPPADYRRHWYVQSGNRRDGSRRGHGTWRLTLGLTTAHRGEG